MKQISWNPFFGDSFTVSSQHTLYNYNFSKEKHKKKENWNQQISKFEFENSITVKKKFNSI